MERILPEQLFYLEQMDGQMAVLTDQEHRHATKVLRHKEGDALVLVDGKGSYFMARIEQVAKDKTLLRIEDQWAEPNMDYRQIHLAVATTKKTDKMEWMLEKLVEIGVGSVTFLETHRTERSRLKEDRLHKTAVSAMKQSKKAHLPTLSFMDWGTFVEQDQAGKRYIATLLDNDQKRYLGSEVLELPVQMAIGPEGGFTEQEVAQAINKGFLAVSLGASRLRTETAGVVAGTILNNLAYLTTF